MPGIRWAADGTLLWGLSCAGLLEQALTMFAGNLATTPEVGYELGRQADRHPFLASAIDAIESGQIETVELTIEDLRLFAKLKILWQITGSTSKNVGEATVVAVGIRPGWGAIIDDGQPRAFLEMSHPQVPLLDTAGVLLHLVDRGIADMHQAWDALCVMRERCGFHHRMARRTKGDWMRRRDYPRLAPLEVP
jgi:hypothetical protein